MEIVIRNSRCFQNLHKSVAAQKYLGYKRFEILYLQNGLAFTCCAISFKTIDQCPWLVEIVSCLFSNDLGWIESTLERLLLGVWKSRNLESGPGNWNGTGTGTSIETGVNWEALKPVPNKIQDGVLCYHCFGKFSAQWSWYHRYTHIRKATCKKKKVKCILLLFLAVINCDCSCRSSNFRQIETTTNQKSIDCEKQPLLVCDV